MKPNDKRTYILIEMVILVDWENLSGENVILVTAQTKPTFAVNPPKKYGIWRELVYLLNFQMEGQELERL